MSHRVARGKSPDIPKNQATSISVLTIDDFLRYLIESRILHSSQIVKKEL